MNEIKNMYKITTRVNNLLWECSDKNDFSFLNNLLLKVDPDKMSTGRLISLISTVRWGKEDLDSYPEFFDKCRISLMKRSGWTEELLSGLEP